MTQFDLGVLVVLAVARLLAALLERLQRDVDELADLVQLRVGLFNIAGVISGSSFIYRLVGIIQREIGTLLRVGLGLNRRYVREREKESQDQGHRLFNSLCMIRTRWRAIKSWSG